MAPRCSLCWASVDTEKMLLLRGRLDNTNSDRQDLHDLQDEIATTVTPNSRLVARPLLRLIARFTGFASC
jgi:hypothetical protein